MYICQAKNNINRGFTLIELLVGLAIVGVLLGLGIPSFSGAIRNNRLTTNANTLITSLSYARSEAIKRNQTIYVRRKGATASNWDAGWDVFIDLNGDQTYTVADTLLKTYPALTNAYTLRTGGNYNHWIAFRSTGVLTSSSGFVNDAFRVCATAGDTANSRNIAFNLSGRGRVTTGGVLSCP